MLPLSRSLLCLRRTFLYGKHLLSSRRIHVAHVDPIIQEFTPKLLAKQPAFALRPRQVRVLEQPSEFYASLLDSIRRAEYRVFISSLYIGSEDTEILDTVVGVLREKASLHVYFQLDLNRSTRPGPTSTAKLLIPLLEEFPGRVHVSMFRSPSLRGLMARLVPPRFNEGWGTWHAKVYGVDNEVIISGANLNKSYFTNRQDRYIHFKTQPLLAQYCFDFLQTVAQFSFHLLPMSASESVSPYSSIRDGYVLSWPDPDTHPYHINDKARQAITAFQSSRQVASQIQLESSDDAFKPGQHILVFPIIQAGQFGIREEESVLELLFRSVNTAVKHDSRKRPLLDLTSGYFSLYQPYQKLVLGSRNLDCRIVAASPKANGFFGSSGVSGRIPEGYTYYEKRFMRAVRKAGRTWREAASGILKGVQLSEWDKPGWTYHAKGIWLSPSSRSFPILTLFGSTNLNSRSAHLDTELSFLMILPSYPTADGTIGASNNRADTAEPLPPNCKQPAPDGEGTSDDTQSLRERLHNEVDNIRANTSTWKGCRRNVRFSTKLIVWLVKGML